MENGDFKRVSEPYLIAAMTFSDAELRVYKELAPNIRGEFIVADITRTELHDIFHYEDQDTWFKCVISYQGMDEESGKSRKIQQNFLVTADSVESASARVKESLATLMVDFTIPQIKLSPIVDIFPFETNFNEEDLDDEKER